jgi:hypothetical protein
MAMIGGCLCGEIRFQVEPATNWCSHCHCSLCRRAHGAGYVTWFGADVEKFTLTEGEKSLTWYRSTPEARRGFCSRCGSTMFFQSERWPDEMHVVLAAMDAPIDREPGAHVFVDSATDWVSIEDGLPRFGGDSGTEPLPDS